MRGFLILILLLFFASCNKDVYICDTEEAYAYHKEDYCTGLENCSEEPILVGLNEAERKKRKPCGYCLSEGYGSKYWISDFIFYLLKGLGYFIALKFSIKITRDWIEKNENIRQHRLWYELLIFLAFLTVFYVYSQTRHSRIDQDEMEQSDNDYI